MGDRPSAWDCRAPMRLAIVGVLAGAMLALAGCGGGGSTVTVMKTTAGSSSAPAKQYSGELPAGVTDEPSQILVAEWPKRWCRAAIGISRVQLMRVMGAVPTEAGSRKIPLIPPLHIGARGQVENNAPPVPAGSDTWEAPGSYQFNAFYDRSLHVQQLDFSGSEQELPCPVVRVAG